MSTAFDVSHHKQDAFTKSMPKIVNDNESHESYLTMTTTPFFCRVCDVTLADTDAWRKHAKDEWHVYKLQCRIAPADAVVLPPSSAALEDTSLAPATARIEGRDEQIDDDEGQSPDSQEIESNTDQDEPQPPTFIPDQCLFCGDKCGTFEDNVAHMTTAHTFIVPYQEYLAVDLETLIWYLHLIIYGYMECIFCGTSRNSLEAVQQHMMAKGHCRFDISSETEDFYEIPASETHESLNLIRPDEMSLRLPSGKLLGHRNQGHAPNNLDRSRLATSTTQSMEIERLESSSHDLQNVCRDGKNMAMLAARISHLSAADQQSLLHLPSHEVRSVLAARKRQLDRATRMELMARSKVERLGNKTLMKHFKNDVPGRLNG